MKKILITGGNGYLGSVLAPFLASHGYDCTIYDTGYFEDCTLFTPKGGYKIIKGDMRNFDDLLLDGIETVVHLSGISNDPLKGLDTNTFFTPTRDYSFLLAKKCKERGIKFIFSSSCSVYGKSNTDLMMKEDSALNPQTPYSLNKQQIEEDITKISDNTFSPIILRFATAFGLSPRIRFDLIVNMFTGLAYTRKKIILNSNGLAWRPVIHIKDIMLSIKCAIEYEHFAPFPLILNVGHNDMNYKVIEMAEMVKTLVPGTVIEFLNQKGSAAKEEMIKDKKIQDGIDNRTYRVDFTKIHEVFRDFNINWNLEKGVEEMINKFEEIKLKQEQFESINYYRLQKMENLLSSGKIDNKLYWNI